MPKWGVEFVSPDHDTESFVEFADALDKSQPYAWQVRRSELDELLFRTPPGAARAPWKAAPVRDVQFDADGATVQVERDDGSRATWRCRYVVDATGRDTLLANKFKTKQKHPDHNSSASSATFTAPAGWKASWKATSRSSGSPRLVLVHPAGRRHHQHRRGVLALLPEVAHKPLPEFFRDTIAMCPELAERLKNARRWSTSGACHRQLLVQRHARAGDRYLRCWAMPSPSSTRCSPRACTWPCTAPSTAPSWWPPRWTGRPSWPPRAALRGHDAQGPARVFVVHLPRDQPDHPRHVHAPAQSAPGEGGADVAAGRRHLQGHADVGRAADVQGAVLLANFRRTWAGWKRHRFNTRDMGVVKGETILKSE
jgi:hypothetical protein